MARGGARPLTLAGIASCCNTTTPRRSLRRAVTCSSPSSLLFLRPPLTLFFTYRLSCGGFQTLPNYKGSFYFLFCSFLVFRERSRRRYNIGNNIPALREGIINRGGELKHDMNFFYFFF